MTAPTVSVSIVPRTPLIDWSAPFDRHWLNRDPAATHAFNALSFLFPQGERFFIESARAVLADTAIDNPALDADVRAFIAQEAIHTRQHQHYNALLERLGYANVAHHYIERLQAFARRRFSPLTRLAAVCGYEHFTAVLGNFVLTHPEVLAQAPPDLALIWGWHAAEETEHKAVCFDLYRAAGGGWLRRIAVYLAVTLDFNLLFCWLYLNMLWRDGAFASHRLPRTAFNALRFFYGRHGVGWHILFHGLRYLSPGFHPWHQDNREKLKRWLGANMARLASVNFNLG